MYNQLLYALDIFDLPEHSIEIIHFHSKKYSLDHQKSFSQNYCFNITCYNPKSYLLKDLINKKAMLIMYDDTDNTHYYHGIITHCTDHQIPSIADSITIHSPLYPLTLNIQHKVYHNVTLPNLIEQLLRNIGWQNYQFQLLLENNYPLREYVVQYQESDFDFLQRKCAFYGVFFTFIQTAYHAILLFCDNIQKLTQNIGIIQLSYYAETGQIRCKNSILSIEWQQQMLADNICLNDYNYRTPDISLLMESPPTQFNSTAVTTDYRFQDHYKSIEEGHFLLNIRQQALDCRRKIWVAKTDCIQLQPGYFLTIINHPITDMNGEFIVTAIEHFADQSAAFPMISDIKKSLEHSYYNIVELMPAYLAYCPTAPEIVYQENCLANISGISDSYAHIDEYGRYLIKPKFDSSDTPADQTRHAVRLIQPLSGNQYGAHFPLHVGTEVLITHLNGDPDRPIIMGVLPNVNSPSPVTADNNTQNIIKTCGGNQLLLDDQLDHKYILLNTLDEQNSLLLDATHGQQRIKIQSLQGNILLQAEKDINSNTQNNHQKIIGNNHEINVQNHAQIITGQGDIHLNSGMDIISNANNDINQTSENGNIILQSTQNMIMHAQQNVELISQNGDLTIQTSNGNILFQAGQDIMIESSAALGHIYIAQGGASIHMAADAITITSQKKINFHAEQIDIIGPINYGEKQTNELVNNLILSYKDEVDENFANIDGVYHIMRSSN